MDIRKRSGRKRMTCVQRHNNIKYVFEHLPFAGHKAKCFTYIFSSSITAHTQKACEVDVSIFSTPIQEATIRQFKQPGRGHNTSTWQTELTPSPTGLVQQAPTYHHAAQGPLHTRDRIRLCDDSYLGGLTLWPGTSYVCMWTEFCSSMAIG